MINIKVLFFYKIIIKNMERVYENKNGKEVELFKKFMNRVERE